MLGHDIAISAPYSFAGAPLDWNGHVIEGAVRDQSGNDIIGARYDYHHADLLITLCDPFGLHGSVRALAKRNVAHWFPVDCTPMGELDVTVLREGAGIPVAMSRFGERVIRGEGGDPLYVPHGVDCALFSPGLGSDYRESAEIDLGTFVVGVNAMNRDLKRKAFYEQMKAFAAFHKRHPDSVLALHTASVSNPGLNLAGMAARLGITDAIRFPDDYAFAASLIGPEQMVSWYRGLDVLSNCSYGEGFGIAAIEAQSCGVPVILADNSTGPELCGAGWLVNCTPDWSPGHGAEWGRPDIPDIESAYEQAWQARENGDMPALTAGARAFAARYDADRVAKEHWAPALERIAERIA